MIKIFTLLCILVGVIACNESAPVSSKTTTLINVTPPQLESANNKSEWKKATIKYFSFEGGFWGIETDKGEKLLPVNLDKAYQQDNLEVMLQGKVLEGTMSIHQWGSPFEISDIKS